jgi:23S rRNA (guanosine2251-2'-O)-methyltransferase
MKGRRDRPDGMPNAVVGRRPALEAVRSGAALEVLVAKGARRTSGLRELLEAAGAAGVTVRWTSADEVAALAGGARDQGVAARILAPRPLTEADLARRAWSEDAVVVALDGVTDPRNVGAIARTAEAAGAEALVLRRHRGATITPAAARASAGTLLLLPVAEVANVARALGRLKSVGFWVVGLHQEAATPVDEARRPPGPLVLVLGAEGEGMSRLVREACDELLSIPMAGSVGSLNVAVAAGVALFGFARRQER